MSVATFIQCYKRPKYLKEQLKAIESQSTPSDRLWVIHNEGGKRIKYPKGAQVVYAKPNLKFHLRFAVGLMESVEYLAFFDDDTIPGPKWFESCIETIERHDCLCVTVGIRIQLNEKWQKIGWCNPQQGEIEVDFGGHAWFMRREHLDYMWHEPIEMYENGEDIMLSANLQRFGGVPTFVPPHPIYSIKVWGSMPDKAVKYGSDKVANWIVEETHFDDRKALIRHYQEKGWKTVLQREAEARDRITTQHKIQPPRSPHTRGLP